MKMLRFVVLTMFAAAPFAGARGVAAEQHAMNHPELPASLVDKVRDATQFFRDTPPNGYDQFLECVSGPQEGAMGVHFVNFSLVDGDLNVETPEALVYERKNGALRLVAVEYIVPVAAWKKSLPPTLEGQSFQLVDFPNRFGIDAFYELHVWAWRDNPNGAFVDWNPHVSCEGR